MRNWAVPATIVVAVEYAFALAIGVRVGFHYRIPAEAYAVLGLTFAILGAAGIVVVKLGMYAIQGEGSPSRRLLSEVPYLANFTVAVILCALQIAVLTWTKVMLPIASPFWADRLLANVDHAIFQIDPWIVTNRLFGWAAPLIDRAYVTWAPIKFATLMFVILMPASNERSRFLISYFLMMATVAIGQYLCSSAGPVFYDLLKLGPRFHNLPVEPWVAQTRNYLWSDHLRAGGAIGGGISAMPSLHVAAALWIALVLRSYRREAGVVGFCYFGLITVGSVLLGWHYAADAIAAVLITVIAWRASAWIVAPKDKQRGDARVLATGGAGA